MHLSFGELNLWPAVKMVNVNQDKEKKFTKHFVAILYLGHTQ